MQVDTVLGSVLSTEINDISVGTFVLCIAVSLVLGFLIASMYQIKTRHTQGFVVTLAIMPAVVCMVILMVNGNIGTGVAVAGTFSLIRFRSVPGTAKEIGAIFVAMGAGLATGMGYLAFATMFVLIVGMATLGLTELNFGGRDEMERTLTITIPEDLDYTGVFDDIFEKYTSTHAVNRVKTTNMGSLFKITYDITVKNPADEKNLIDALRCRNGNLEIMMTKQPPLGSEL